MADFTILSKEEYEKYGFSTKAGLTDFAILHGCIPIDYENAITSNNYRGIYWTSNPGYDDNTVQVINSKTGKFYASDIDKETNINMMQANIGIRPAVFYSSLPKEFIKHIRKINSKVDLVEFGYFPQFALPKKLQENFRIFSRVHLDTSKHHFYVRNRIENYNLRDIPQTDYKDGWYTHDEEIFDHKNYMCVTPMHNFPSDFYFKKYHYAKPYISDVIAFDIEPIRWYLNKEEDIMVSEYILYAGEPYPYVKEFLNVNFYNYIFYPYVKDYEVGNKSQHLRKIWPYGGVINFYDKIQENIDYDFSSIESMSYGIFKDFQDLQKLDLPYTLNNLGRDVFKGCKNLDLNIRTSLFSISSLTKSNEHKDEILKDLFDVNSLILFDTKIDLNNFNSRCLIDLRIKECIKLITYLLKKYNLKYNDSFFKKILESASILVTDGKTLYKQIIDTTYNYICLHLLHVPFSKKTYVDNMNKAIDEFYTDYFMNFKVAKQEQKKSLIIENPLNKYDVKSVYNLLKKEEIGNLTNDDAVTIMDYGSNFDNYFGYIANTFSIILNREDVKKKDTINLINLFDKYSLIYDNKINDDVLNELLNYLSNTEKKAYDRICNIEECKKLMNLYISKICEMQNILKQKEDNPFIISKIDGLSKLLLSIKMQGESINSILENEFNYYGIVSNINKTLFPHLLLMISNHNTDEINKVFTLIMESLETINNEEKQKQKKLK